MIMSYCEPAFSKQIHVLYIVCEHMQKHTQYKHMHAHTHTHMYTRTHVCVCVCVCIFFSQRFCWGLLSSFVATYVCVLYVFCATCMCVCVCVC